MLLDYSMGKDVTQYVLVVNFDSGGRVLDIDMES